MLSKCPGTCCVAGLKALPLDGVIGEELEEHLVAGGQDGLWFLCPAEPAEDGGLGVFPIVSLQVVISALLVTLNVQLCEGL